MQHEMAGVTATPLEADWLRLVERSLGGRPVASLRPEIAPGLAADPLRAAGTMPPLWSRSGNRWTRLQRIDRSVADVEAGLAAGADGFEIVLAGSAADHAGGVAIADLGPLLERLPLDRRPLRFAAGAAHAAVVAALDDAVARGRLDPALLDIAFGFDPFAGSARGRPDAADTADLGPLVARLTSRGWRGPFLTADARLVHAAGGSPLSELAYAAAAIVGGLRLLLDAGVPDASAAAAIDVALAADEDQFVTIAKFRAMRLIQARILVAAGLLRARLALHGETAWRMLAAEDVRSNLIRSTVAALSAGLGGADSLTVLPFAAATGADADADRLALTTQAVLIEEAHLARVSDPGAGSGTIEQLTLGLAAGAWVLFQQIEGEGGLPATLASGRFAELVASEADKRAQAIASGERAIVGVTLFRADGEPQRAAREAAPAPGLGPRRDAAPFERLAP